MPVSLLPHGVIGMTTRGWKIWAEDKRGLVIDYKKSKQRIEERATRIYTCTHHTRRSATHTQHNTPVPQVYPATEKRVW